MWLLYALKRLDQWRWSLRWAWAWIADGLFYAPIHGMEFRGKTIRNPFVVLLFYWRNPHLLTGRQDGKKARD